MASQKKCKKCGTKNDKIRKLCSHCGAMLYKDVPYKIAIKVTLLLDMIMTFIYISSIFILIDITTDINIDKVIYIQSLPIPETFSYYILIAFFAVNAIVKIFFILNHFIFKTYIFIFIRRIFMFVECVFMFPFQTIMALYFYNPATKKTNSDIV